MRREGFKRSEVQEMPSKCDDSESTDGLRTFSERDVLLSELERLTFGVPPDSLENEVLRDEVCR